MVVEGRRGGREGGRGWCEKWWSLEGYLYGGWVKKRLEGHKCSQKNVVKHVF